MTTITHKEAKSIIEAGNLTTKGHLSFAPNISYAISDCGNKLYRLSTYAPKQQWHLVAELNKIQNEG